MRIWLDDERQEPEGWIRCYWPDEVIKHLETGKVEKISLDHDLGDDERGTGYDVLMWIEDAVGSSDFKPPRVMHLHTANPSARQRMQLAVYSIKRLYYARKSSE